MKSILLKHIGGMQADVQIIDADYFKNGRRTNPYLKVRFGIAGVYYLDLVDNCLQMSKNRNTWSAVDLGTAWKLWYEWNHKKDEYLRMIPVEYRKGL